MSTLETTRPTSRPPGERGGRRGRIAFATGVLLAVAATGTAFFLATSSGEAEVSGGRAALQLDVTMTNRPLYPLVDGSGGAWQWDDLTGREHEASVGTLALRNVGESPLEAALSAVAGADDYSISSYAPGDLPGYEQVDHLLAVLCPDGAERISPQCSVTRLDDLPDSGIGFGRVDAVGDANDVQRRRLWVFLADSGEEQPSAVLTTLTWSVEARTP